MPYIVKICDEYVKEILETVYQKLQGSNCEKYKALCQINFDYFYGGESELFSYYRIPRLLVTGEQFRNLSTDAKLLYGLLLDRMSLSAKNGWFDSQGRVYIYYPLDEVEMDLNCGHGKAVKLMAELDTDTGIGLIERVRQGLCRPSIIYVKQFTSKAISKSTGPPNTDVFGSPKIELPKVSKLNFRTSDNRTSGLPITEPPEVQISEVPYNGNNYLDKSYLYISINQSNQAMDTIDREKVKACVKENIGYIAFTDQQRPQVDELVELMVDILCSPQASFRIGGAQFKSQIVKKRLAEIEQSHIAYVLDCMSKNTTKIRNIRGYLLTTLYNAPTTIEHYYQAAVQHDLYGPQSGRE